MTIPAEYQKRDQRYNLARSAIPMNLASSGSMGNNGALTGLTALPRTYANCYLYLPASAISAGSAAGWYFAQMSSTTAGTVFNNVYTTGVPTIPSSPTAFVTTGPGAFVGDTSEQGVTITVPANSMGANGEVVITAQWGCTTSGSNKTFRFRFSGSGGTQFFAFVATTLVTLRTGPYGIANQGVTNSQMGWVQAVSLAVNQSGTSTIEPVTSAVDTTADTTLFISSQHALATDNQVLERFLVELLYGA